MSKYRVGDRFICEITEVDEGGMGDLYSLNSGQIVTSEKVLSNLEYIKPTPVKNDVLVKTKKVTRTPEELRERIFRLSKLLAESIETYEQITATVNQSVETIDRVCAHENKE